jgi:hypothetical protein
VCPFANSLQAEEEWLTDSDVTDGEEEVWLEIEGNTTSILVEVKTARTDRVRMTPTQAKKAREEQARFALCVVPLADDSPTREVVRDECRFVFDIGQLLDEPLRDYVSLLKATNEARQQAGADRCRDLRGTDSLRSRQARLGRRSRSPRSDRRNHLPYTAITLVRSFGPGSAR